MEKAASPGKSRIEALHVFQIDIHGNVIDQIIELVTGSVLRVLGVTLDISAKEGVKLLDCSCVSCMD